MFQELESFLNNVLYCYGSLRTLDRRIYEHDVLKGAEMSWEEGLSVQPEKNWNKKNATIRELGSLFECNQKKTLATSGWFDAAHIFHWNRNSYRRRRARWISWGEIKFHDIHNNIPRFLPPLFLLLGILSSPWEWSYFILLERLWSSEAHLLLSPGNEFGILR